MKNISTNKIDNKNILIVKMDKLMLSKVSQIASITLGSSFVNENILDNDINLCAKIDKKDIKDIKDIFQPHWCIKVNWKQFASVNLW